MDCMDHKQLEWGPDGLVKGHYPSADEYPFLCFSSCCEWASQVVQLRNNCAVGARIRLPMRHKKHRFDPWVGKIPWRGKWQPSLVFLPGKFHGQRSLAGPSPRGGKELHTTEHTRTHAMNAVIDKIHLTLDKNNRSSHFFLENNTCSFLILFSLKPSLTWRRFTCARWAQDVVNFCMEH